VINIVSTRARRQTVEIKPQFGNRDSRKADFFASDVWGRFGVAVDGSFFDTDGFPIVAPRERGPIDNNADVTYKNLTAKLEYDPTAALHATFRATRFSEEALAVRACVQIVNAYLALKEPTQAEAAAKRGRWILKRIPDEAFASEAAPGSAPVSPRNSTAARAYYDRLLTMANN